MSWATVLKDSRCSFNEPAVVRSVVLSKKDLCPLTAKSCLHYDDCCVPKHGNLILAQQWLTNKPIQAFTIHGFWSNYCISDTPTPASACPASRLTLGVPEIINSDLGTGMRHHMKGYWISGRLTNEILWSHEWKDHGVCLSTVQPKCHSIGLLPNELNNPNKAAIRYFNLAINQYFNFDIYNELRAKGIEPRNEPYTRREFREAMSRWNGFYTLHCLDGAIDQIKFYLLGAARNNFDLRLDTTRGDDCGQQIYYRPKVARTDL